MSLDFSADEISDDRDGHDCLSSQNETVKQPEKSENKTKERKTIQKE